MQTDHLGFGDKPRPIIRDLVLLTALCALVNVLGLTSFGGSSWQESVRLLASQDMQSRGEWIVPTINGEPYLAKPPLVYWVTIAFAEITGKDVSLGHLRMTVAMFGWLSVVLTYLAGRSILTDGLAWSAQRASHAAWWASLFLATGFLHVRMSRTGAIDIAATPFVIGAVWAAFISWRSTDGWRLRIGLAIVAAGMAGGASLVKGPPTILAILCPVVGGVLGWIATSSSTPRSWKSISVSAAAFIAVASAGASRVEEPRDVFGLLLGAFSLAALVWVMSGVAGTRASEAAQSLWRCQLLSIFVGALVPFVIWSKLVALRIGAQAMNDSASAEMAANISIFQPSAAAQLFEATSYGVGLGSPWAFLGAWVLITRRERMTPGIAVVAAWVGVTLVAFAAFSTGSGRYLTPMWPGVALLGAVGWVSFRDRFRRDWFVPTTYTTIVVLAIGQTWWYGIGRAQFQSNHSPRDYISTLADRTDIDHTRVASWGFWNGGLTTYMDHHVFAITRDGYDMYSPIGEWTLDEFANHIRIDNHEWIVLVSHRDLDGDDIPGPPTEFLECGLTAEYLHVDAEYSERKGKHSVRAFRVLSQ